jgi:hypothetical protein
LLADEEDDLAARSRPGRRQPQFQRIIVRPFAGSQVGCDATVEPAAFTAENIDAAAVKQRHVVAVARAFGLDVRDDKNSEQLAGQRRRELAFGVSVGIRGPDQYVAAE